MQNHVAMRHLCTLILLLAFWTAAAQQDKRQLTGINLENIPYPFPVKYISLKPQGENLRMAYMDLQPARANGHSVLLLHGKNFCAAYWERTAKDLAEKGYRVVMPDQLGFGKSAKPRELQYSFRLLAANTAALLDSLDIDNVCVLGHSMGGMLATRFALMYPERTEKLVLENPIGLEDWSRWVPYQTVDAWYAAELKQSYAAMKAYQQENYYAGTWSDAYEHWLDIPAGWLGNIDYPRIAWNSALQYDMIFTQPVCYEWSRIQCPVLLIIGQSDRTAIGKDKADPDKRALLGNYPVLGRRTAAKIKKCELLELPGVGHAPHIQAYPRFIKPLLAFLPQ
jgi:pimeloyl-ACP methyl ester carboxylesterase